MQPTDSQQHYIAVPTSDVDNSSHPNAIDIEMRPGNSSKAANKTDKMLGILPVASLVALGSVYCLVVLGITLIVPVLQLTIGVLYRNQCPINSNIPIYLIVAGALGIAVIVLLLAMVIPIICLVKQESLTGSIVFTAAIVIILVLTCLMGIFLLGWFIAGNIWIFGARKNVIYDDPASANYCHRTLYEFAFWLLVATYVMPLINCFLSCCRGRTSD